MYNVSREMRLCLFIVVSYMNARCQIDAYPSYGILFYGKSRMHTNNCIRLSFFFFFFPLSCDMCKNSVFLNYTY